MPKSAKPTHYAKIPLSHLPDNLDSALWKDHAKSLLCDLRKGVIPMWAVSDDDLDNITIEKEKK